MKQNAIRKELIHERAVASPEVICRALGLREYQPEKGRWWCPFCQNDGREHKDGDFSTVEGFTCHKCGWKGDAFDLVMAVKEIEFFPAMLFLCDVYGIPKPEPKGNEFDFDGCSMEQFSEAKRLPISLLKSMDISEFKFKKDGKPVLRFPYHQPDGTSKATRLRFSLNGKKKNRWRKGDKPTLYGHPRIGMAHKAGFVVIVEGESDSLTCWHHDIPAIGLPGAPNWNEKRDANVFQGIDIIYIVIEPDDGGEAVKKWLAESSIRHRARLLDLGEHKDPSGLYLSDPEGFTAAMHAAMERAVPWSVIEAKQRQEQHVEAWTKCKSIATSPDILGLVVETAERLGLVGESRLVQSLYLALTSRLFKKPISIAVKGASSTGKSFSVETVLKMFPASAYYALTAMSEHALAYSEEPLKSRVLVIYEASGMESDFQTYLIRSLLSEGCVRYETVEKTQDGMKARLIEREGPTGLVVTTTSTALHQENETRLLSLNVTDTQKQTAAILQHLAMDDDEDPPDLAPWHAFQEWLSSAPADVAIPYKLDLAKLIPPVAVRLRRDFSQLLSLIRAHALTHQHSRDRDAKGRILATLADYAAVRDLVAGIMADGVEATVPAVVRETVHAVQRLRTEDGVSIRSLGEALELDRSAAYRRYSAAKNRGFLKNLETKRGRPISADLADPMPDDIQVLPSVEDLCACARTPGGVKIPPPPSAPSETEPAGIDMEEVTV